MKRRDGPPSSFWRVWRWPIVLAALTMFGLLSALLGQHGVWHWLSWGMLGVPLVVIFFFAARIVTPRPPTRVLGPHAGKMVEVAELDAAPTASKEAT